MKLINTSQKGNSVNLIKTGLIAITTMALALPLASNASPQSITLQSAMEDATIQLIESHVDQQNLLRKTARIHSEIQLASFLSDTKNNHSPINLLSRSARGRFLESLRFNETGVTSFYYADIESELSSSQAYELLSLFGIQSTLSFMGKIRIETTEDREIMSTYANTSPLLMKDDHKEYWCSGSHTCSRSVGSICMSGC
jgi:hypothetical protein